MVSATTVVVARLTHHNILAPPSHRGASASGLMEDKGSEHGPAAVPDHRADACGHCGRETCACSRSFRLPRHRQRRNGRVTLRGSGHTRGRTRAPIGLKIAAIDDETLTRLESYVPTGLGWLVVDAPLDLRRPTTVARMARSGLRVIVETIEWDDRLAALSGHHALQVKGHEAGGFIGEETSFHSPAEGSRATVGAGISCAAASACTARQRFARPAPQASCSMISCCS